MNEWLNDITSIYKHPLKNSHPASTNQELDLLWSEQVLERRLVGDHVEASPERLELLLHAFVQNVLWILCNKLLYEHTSMRTFNKREPWGAAGLEHHVIPYICVTFNISIFINNKPPAAGNNKKYSVVINESWIVHSQYFIRTWQHRAPRVPIASATSLLCCVCAAYNGTFSRVAVTSPCMLRSYSIWMEDIQMESSWVGTSEKRHQALPESTDDSCK